MEASNGKDGRDGLPGQPGATGSVGRDSNVSGPKGEPGAEGKRGLRGKSAPRRALVGYVILAGFVFLALFSSYQTDQHLKQNQIKNCQFAEQNRLALRSVLIDARNRTRTSKQRTAEEKAEAEEFYRKALKGLPIIECDESGNSSIKTSLRILR